MTKMIVSTLVLFALVSSLVLHAAAGRVPTILNYDGTLISYYGDVIKTSDGNTYRVTISRHAKQGEPTLLSVDMTSLEKAHTYIAGAKIASVKSWYRISDCSETQVKQSSVCDETKEAEALLNEALAMVATRRNVIGNFELLWSWEMGTKEMLNKIREK